MKFNCLCLLLLVSLNQVHSDLPVHCKKEQIEGLWTFRISNDKFDADLGDGRVTCGHGLPDRIDNQVGDTDFTFNSSRDIEVHLASDYIVYEDSKAVGNWSPIYDEAFIVNYKTSTFTAFLKYYKKDSYSSNDDKAFISNCDKTMLGWFIPNNNENTKNWSCFFGIKSQVLNSCKDKFLIAQPVQGISTFMELNIKLWENAKTKLMTMKYDEQADLVNQVNSLNLGWKADINEEFKGLSFFELKEKLGLLRDKKMYEDSDFEYKDSFNTSNQPTYLQTGSATEDITNILNTLDKIDTNGPETVNDSIVTATTVLPNSQGLPAQNQVDLDSQYVTDYSIISKYINKELNEIDINNLPKNWDWRNVGGQNYVPSPRLQLNCGSCYVFSMVSSLESRLRVLTNNEDKTEFSRQFPLSCSFYTEGCKGGYPILVAKFFNEFEIIPESCFQYNPDKIDCSGICDYKQYTKKYFVSKYGYLGGFYGATSEIDLIKEIRARGPIPGNMSVPLGFSYYKSGIFSQNELIKNSGHFSSITLFDKNISWTNVDHSILLVGYGEENGVKYWIGMNTWGEKWGENGYFRILRGENDCNIETMGDVARISFKNRNG
jgi:C1A family cysteine protease